MSTLRSITFATANCSINERPSMTPSTSAEETGTTSAPRFGYSRRSPSDSSCTNASRTGVRLSSSAPATSPSLSIEPPGNLESSTRCFVYVYARSVAPRTSAGFRVAMMHLYRSRELPQNGGRWGDRGGGSGLTAALRPITHAR
jgi:hypothetical protein